MLAEIKAAVCAPGILRSAIVGTVLVAIAPLAAYGYPDAPSSSSNDAIKRRFIAREDYLERSFQYFLDEGRISDAQQAAEDLIDVREALYGKDSPQVQDARSKLAFCLWASQLEPKDARVFREAMRPEKSAYEKYGDRRYREALAAAEKQAEMLSKLRAPETMVYADLLHFIAFMHWQLADYRNFEKSMRKYMAVLEKTVGRTSPAYTKASAELSEFYLVSGDFVEALRLCEQARAAYASAVGEDNAEYAYYLTRVARIEAWIGWLGRAERHLLKAVALTKNSDDDSSDFYSECLGELAEVYRCADKYSAAEPLLLEARSYSENHFDSDDSRCIRVSCELGSLYLDMDRIDEAKPLLTDGFKLAHATFRRDNGNGDISGSAQSLGKMCLLQKDLPNAERLLRESLDLKEEKFGKDNPLLISILSAYAKLLRKTDRESEAERFDLRRKKLEDSLLAIRQHYAAVYGEKEYPIALEDQKLTIDHPDLVERGQAP